MSMDETFALARPDGKLSIPLRFPSSDFDAERYRIYVEGFDIDDEQANELLATIWSIMRMFVELGFEPHICEQLFENPSSECETESAIAKSPEEGGRST